MREGSVPPPCALSDLPPPLPPTSLAITRIASPDLKPFLSASASKLTRLVLRQQLLPALLRQGSGDPAKLGLSFEA